MIGTFALLALVHLQDGQGFPVKLRDGGFCAGISWVTLQAGETVTMDRGPDFRVFRVQGPGDRWWGVYGGTAGHAAPDRSRPLLARDGATVYRGTEQGENGKVAFGGYFVGRRFGQNHFFGNVFKDAPSDRAFFARVRFGKVADRMCEAERGRENR